jgi:hypothetical protein
MTSNPPAADTEPHPDHHTERLAKPAERQASDDMPWPETDPTAEPSSLDADVAAAAKALFFAPDLIRPGPGLLPFGAKARDRRERRHQVDMIAATRRAELGRLLAARRNSRIEPSIGATRRGDPHLVAAVLGAIVILVAVAGWLMPLTTTTAAPSLLPADTFTAATDLPLYEPDPTALGTIGATTTQPDSGVDLTTPESAAASWLTAWCPAKATRDPDAVTAGIRATMTADGWAQFTATPGQLLVAAAPGTTASCDTPTARIVARPPGSDNTVVVLVSATRTITEPDADSDAENAEAAAGFRIERLQYVVRGDDGVWRVDLAAVGG